jgi:hypothetical protein
MGWLSPKDMVAAFCQSDDRYRLALSHARKVLWNLRLSGGLGHPEPPLILDDVRALLRLDRQYYSKTNTGWVDDAINRLTLATKQIIARPTLLFDAIAKWDLRALYLPDRKRILIDEAVPARKQRWIEGHEITHGVLPWHAELMLGDTEQTLNPACHEQLEAEANYGAGQLLFLRRRFISEASDLPLTIESVRQLAAAFGNTMTSTLWRLVESVHADRLLFAAVTAHPHPRFCPVGFDETDPCRYFIRSPAFARRFSRVTEDNVFEAIQSYCAPRRGGPLGEAQIPIIDDADDPHIFSFETFFNRHDALTLAVHLRPRHASVSVPTGSFGIRR